MSRRGLPLTLLVILAVQLLGGSATEPVCLEPCADDADESGCAPVCALCTTCVHAQPAIARQSVSAVPMLETARYLPEAPPPRPSQLASDIFHVPLRG